MNYPLRVLLIVLLASVVGCGGEKKIYAKVKGTVTFNGKPLDKGEITFSVPGKPPTLITVSDGKFSGQALVGANTISISAKKKGAAPPKLPPQAIAMQKAYREKGVDKGGADPNANFDALTSIELIPAEWNKDTKQVREVQSGAENDFEFNIKS